MRVFTGDLLYPFASACRGGTGDVRILFILYPGYYPEQNGVLLNRQVYSITLRLRYPETFPERPEFPTRPFTEKMSG